MKKVKITYKKYDALRPQQGLNLLEKYRFKNIVE